MVDEVKLIEQCQVSPPQGSLPSSINLPLTHLDLFWFYCPLVKRIFYYNFPHSTQHFLQTSLPILKNSLSLTLQHFFPFCSKSILPPKPQTPHILYTQGDSLSLTICESNSNFNNLISNPPKDFTLAYPFVPLTPPPTTLQDGTLLFPTMAIQITIFPNFGFTICLSFRHEIVDGKSFHHFIKFWSSLSKGNLEISSLPLPFHKREIIQDPKGLKQNHLEELWNSPPNIIESTSSTHDLVSSRNNLVRYRFNLTRHHVDNLKKKVVTKSQNIGLELLHLSTFVVTCSLLWVSMVKLKSQEKRNIIVDCVANKVTNNSTLENDLEDNYGFKFIMDMRNRFELSIPSTYFGNCLMPLDAKLPKRKLMEENGIYEAANVIAREISLANPSKEAKEFDVKSQNITRAIGSPKFDVYETNFGWGNPILSEILHVNDSSELLLSDSKDGHGGIEVSMVLEEDQVKKFSDILEVELRDIVVFE